MDKGMTGVLIGGIAVVLFVGLIGTLIGVLANAGSYPDGLIEAEAADRSTEPRKPAEWRVRDSLKLLTVTRADASVPARDTVKRGLGRSLADIEDSWGLDRG